MRGEAARQAIMLTAVTPDGLVPKGHPIRRIKPRIKPLVERALAQLSPTPASHMPITAGPPFLRNTC